MTSTSDGCIDPAGISDEAIIAYATGEAEASASSHIERCPGCRGRAEVYARSHNLVGFGLWRSSCPPSLTLGEYALGLLNGEALQQTAAHLSECPRCLAESRAFSAFLAEPDTVPAAGILHRLRRLFLQPLQAPAPVLAGLRGAATSESITYEDAESSWRVHLSLERSAQNPRARTLTGLVERATGAAASASLYQEGAAERSGELDLGSFYFDGLTEGTYRLELSSDETTAVIEGIRVG
jgi:anti-sigma factor RsiW